MSSEDNLDKMFEENKRQNVVNEKHAGVDKAIDALLHEAASFQESKHQLRGRILKVAWFLVGGLSVSTVSLAVAIAVMMPLKQIQPMMVRTFDDGYAEVIRDFSEGIQFEAEVDEYFLKEYVSTRETYDWHKMQYIADYTKAWSAPHVYNEYYNFIISENGVLNTLKDKGRIDTRITSINLNKSAGVATVRFIKTPQKPDGSAIASLPQTHWLAEVQYTMTGNQKHKDREYNPFGYNVLSYKLVQEKAK